MKVDFQTYKKNILFYIFILSLFVGSGISFYKVYLFHLILPIVFVVGLLKIKWNFKIFFEKKYYIIYGFFLFIFLTSILGIVNLSFLYFYFVSFVILLTIILYSEYLKKHFKEIFLFILMLISIDFIIGLLEVFTSFRYPISKFSFYNEFIGYPNFNLLGSECYDLAYALSSPTGFHWNQNDYAFVLLLSLPFTYLLSNQWLRNGFRLLLLFLVLETGSRIGIYISFSVFIFIFFQELKQKKITILAPFLFVIFVLTDGFYIFPSFNKKIKEVAIVSKSVFYQKFPEHCYQKYKSSEARTQLTKIALTEIKSHPLIGKGAGSFTASLEEKTKNSSNYKTQNLVTNPHNFILEILVEFGLIILIPIGLIVVQIMKRFKFLSKKERFSFTLFFVMIIPMSIMTSSLVYFLPFYLFLYLIIIYILQKDKETSIDFDEK